MNLCIIYFFVDTSQRNGVKINDLSVLFELSTQLVVWVFFFNPHILGYWSSFGTEMTFTELHD